MSNEESKYGHGHTIGPHNIPHKRKKEAVTIKVNDKDLVLAPESEE